MWTIKYAIVQRDYVVIDLEKKDDQITFTIHEFYHPFNRNECK